jgi:hypothetical protein
MEQNIKYILKIICFWVYWMYDIGLFDIHKMQKTRFTAQYLISLQNKKN